MTRAPRRAAATLSCLAVCAAVGMVSVATTGCEDARPPSAPRGHHERDALVLRWNALSARLEADNEPRVHARLAPGQDAELNAAVMRAVERLHDARRALEHSNVNLPEQAMSDMLDVARAALDDAEGAVGRADAIRAGTEAPEAGVAVPGDS